MKRLGLLFGFLAGLALLLPVSTAQDAKKKDADKTDKKEAAKKDAVKKDGDKTDKKEVAKKDDPKKEDEKDEKKKAEPKKAPEKLVFGVKFRTKILAAKADSNREYVIEISEIDPKKVFDFNKWKFDRSGQLAAQRFEAMRQTDFNTRMAQLQNYQKDLFNFNVEVAKGSNNLSTTKSMEVRAADNAKVRSILPPVEFDDQTGKQIKFTKKELDARRDKTGLPGFAADFDAVKPGVFVEIYMAKEGPMVKAKKKGPDDDDIPVNSKKKEFVLIVIMGEGK